MLAISKSPSNFEKNTDTPQNVQNVQIHPKIRKHCTPFQVIQTLWTCTNRVEVGRIYQNQQIS